MDVLQSAFDTYKKLLKIEYHVVVGKKGKVTNYILYFDKEHFKHIFGFHKLKDNEQLYKSASARLFRDVSSGKITYDTIKKSRYYSEIDSRLQNIVFLEEYLDTFQEFYKWDSRKSPISKIVAEIMITNISRVDNTAEVFLFFNRQDCGKIRFSVCIEETPISVIQTCLNYRQGQDHPLAILLIEKCNLESGDKIEVFRSSTYNPTEKDIKTEIFV